MPEMLNTIIYIWSQEQHIRPLLSWHHWTPVFQETIWSIEYYSMSWENGMWEKETKSFEALQYQHHSLNTI